MGQWGKLLKELVCSYVNYTFYGKFEEHAKELLAAAFVGQFNLLFRAGNCTLEGSQGLVTAGPLGSVVATVRP